MEYEYSTAVLELRRPYMQKLLLFALAARVNHHGECAASIASIATDTGLARRTVQLHLGALLRANIIRRDNRPGQRPLIRFNVGPRRSSVPPS